MSIKMEIESLQDYNSAYLSELTVFKFGHFEHNKDHI